MAYQFLDKRVRNDTFDKIFEVGGQSDYLYIFTHNNKQINRSNMQNPYLGELTVSRVRKSAYTSQDNTVDLYENLMDRQPRICLHEFIPGTVQKIAFDQVHNHKVALLYRILVDTGFIYRVRIFKLTELEC